MKLAQPTPQLKSNTTVADVTTFPSQDANNGMNVAARHQRPAIRRRQENRELAYQEKVKLAQAHLVPPVQGSSTTAGDLTLAPTGSAESIPHEGSVDLTDKTIQSFAIHDDQTRSGPTLSYATSDDWSSSLDTQSKASLKTNPDNELQVTKRAAAENRKMQQQQLTISAPVSQEEDQRSSQMFEGQGLCLAPASEGLFDEESNDSEKKMREAIEGQGLCLAPAREGLFDEESHNSDKKRREAIENEKQDKYAGKSPSSSYLPTRIQADNNSNHNNGARGIQEESPPIDSISASGITQELTTTTSSSVSSSINTGSAQSSSRDSSQPTNRMRTPAPGYTVNAFNKGPREHGIAPGAIAVTQQPISARTGSRGRTDSNDSDDALISMMTYSATAEHHSTRGNAFSTHGVQGSDSAQSTWGSYPDESYSNLPPEMTDAARRQHAALFSSGVSSSSLDGKIDEKSGKNPRTICIIVGIVVMVIALATGLGVGIGGNDDPTPATETEDPTLPLNISYFKSLVEDFYDGGGTVLEDTNSPQHHALVWLASDSQSESLDSDRIRTLYALAVFYYSTNGDDFISNPTWSGQFGFLNSTTENVCKWNNGDVTYNPKGLWCDSTETKVERLYFSTNNLVGAIPEEIGMLKDLQYILLSENNLASTLPDSLFALSTLKVVDLKNNALTGLIPSTFAEATSLEAIDLRSNDLQGSIPLDHIVDSVFCPLQLVVLEGNTFSGTFPLESIAANCTDIIGININDCGLVVEGSIPSIGLEQLTSLGLSKTKLGGRVPDEISRLRRLQRFTAENNLLTGSLPASLGDLMNLTELSLSGNSINGTIPSTLGQLHQLKTLNLQLNSLGGTIPSELGLCINLETVKLQMNFFSGEIDFLCPLSLDWLLSDCSTGDVVCSCCNQCF